MVTLLTRRFHAGFEVQALSSFSRTGSRPSVTLVGGACVNCTRSFEGPVYQCRSRADPESAVCHCFPGGGLGNLGVQCAGIRHRLETEHEKLAAVHGGANTRVNWKLDHLKFFGSGTDMRFDSWVPAHTEVQALESLLHNINCAHVVWFFQYALRVNPFYFRTSMDVDNPRLRIC